MVSLKSLLITAAVAVAIPLDEELFGRSVDFGSKLPHNDIAARQQGGGDKEGNGFHSGYYYSFWSDGSRGSVTYKNGNNGSYTSNWSNIGNWVGGKGWNPGGSMTIVYNGTWTAQNQNSYLALYGWTRNPLVEYYVVEAFGTYNPSSGTQRKGTIQSDGGTYDIYETKRNNQPSIEGRKSFTQFWSVRQGRRVGGEITTGNHFAAWEKSGLKLGTHDYMLLGTEGYGSSGSSAINVMEKGATSKPYPNEPDSRKDNN